MANTNRTICLFLLILILEGSYCNTKYFVKMRTNASELFKTRNDNLRVTQEPIAATQSPLFGDKIDYRNNDDRMIKDALISEYDKRNPFETSTFNPDVLNKFLEEYANKIKSSTEKDFKLPFRISKPTVDPLILEVNESTTDVFTTVGDDEKSTLDPVNSTVNEDRLSEVLNDTLKRNKYYGTSTHDDRNGWVTLDAIPWSKSKISKWQANPSTQRPWPEIKPWEKPSIAKPWTSDYSSRPIYENNKPWNEKPKPYWQQENNNEKPWQKPPSSSRPSYYSDKYDQVPSQAQKWPPEKPSWDKYPSDIHRPSDIITDDRPTNFPNTWNNRPQSSRPYPFLDRYSDSNHADESNNDWHDFPPRTESLDRPRPNEGPNFSHYQYGNTHPPSHPANGDGQWVLLSTNRGYSKSRQRSIKIDTLTPEMTKVLNGSKTKTLKRENTDATVPVMTSKRQVRLTVLPSINGTNTTTSHGGLLEVEKTFKSVEQSRKEYERDRTTTTTTTLPSILRRRPIRNTLNGGQASSSAVLAAVGAGMLPATMAMMIPMMLGRKKRDLSSEMDDPRKFHSIGINLHNIGKIYDGGRTKRRYL